MTTESKALVERVQATPPSRLPNDSEIKEIMSVFHGWGAAGRVPLKPTAVILWKLIQMGFSPHDINIIGDKPYVNVDGFTGHAHRLLAAQGRHYGIDFMTRFRLVTDKQELELAGARQGDTTIAWEFMVPKWRKLTHPDGTVEETREWQVAATEWGRGNPTNTVIKTPQGGEQPIEKMHPQRMAVVRATRHGWKMVAPVTLPADVGMFDEALKVAIDEDAIEGTYRSVPDEALPEGVPAADTAIALTVPEATQEPEQASPPAEAPVAPAVPTIKSAHPEKARTLAEVKADRQLVEDIKAGLAAADAMKLVRDFGYDLQLGVEAVLQLAAEGYSVEQIVAVVKGVAKPSLGWE